MNKAELIEKVAEKAGLSKKDAAAATDAVFAAITDALKEKDSVRLIGFGTFETRQRKERVGRNPHNPEETVVIPAATVPTFKAGKGLKDAVNK